MSWPDAVAFLGFMAMIVLCVWIANRKDDE